MFYRARYYNPTYQRFISQDPIGFAGRDVNLYAYVGNNPVNWFNPNGLNPVAGAVVGGSIGGPPGAVVGGIIGFGIGVYIGDKMFNETSDATGPENAPPIPTGPGDSPSEGWEWKGSGLPESGKGNWVNPETGQKLHPDLNQPAPKGPHWGLTNPDGRKWDFFPDKGKWEKCP